jgi:hypothetical protein
METILVIMTSLGIFLIALLYANEKLIPKLPESSKLKAFWRRHVCIEDEDVI